MSERTPESLIAAATPGPNPENMSGEPPPSLDVEFDWIPVSSWSSNVMHLNEDGENWDAVVRDIERIITILRALQSHERSLPMADRGVPPTPVYTQTISMLYDALAGRRHELCEMIMKIQKLPLPDDEVLPPAERPA